MTLLLLLFFQHQLYTLNDYYIVICCHTLIGNCRLTHTHTKISLINRKPSKYYCQLVKITLNFNTTVNLLAITVNRKIFMYENIHVLNIHVNKYFNTKICQVEITVHVSLIKLL